MPKVATTSNLPEGNQVMSTIMQADQSVVEGLLTSVEERLSSGDVFSAISELGIGLNAILAANPQSEWTETICPSCREHSIMPLLLQDPYTRRALEKPRGYSGDAVMLDYVYSQVPPHDTTALGAEIFQATTGVPAGRSVVERRDLLAALIDSVAQEVHRPRILSVACGHLREAQLSEAVRSQAVGEFFALDQDAESLAVVEAEQGPQGVKPIYASVRSLLTGTIRFTHLDFAYAAGLLDYLPTPAATALCSVLFSSLAPGGRLLVGNYAPNQFGRGYMEAFMDWHLVHRDEAGMERLKDGIASDEICSQQVYRDVHQNVVYLELTKVA